MKRLIIIITAIIAFTNIFCQDPFYLIDTTNFHQLSQRERNLLDSLLSDYNTLITDTEKVTFLFNMYSQMNDNNVWIEYLKLIHDKLKQYKNSPEHRLFYLKYMSKYYNDYGYYYDYIGLNDSTWVFYEKSYQINLELNDTSLIALSLNNLAMQYKFKGEIDKSIEMNLKGIKLLENTKWLDQLALAYNNLGAIYHNQAKYEESLDYYFKALKIFEDLNNLKGAGLTANNIGSIYQNTGDLSSALEYYHKSYNIHKKRGNKIDMATILFKIGGYYLQLDDYNAALNEFRRALKNSREGGYVRNVSISMNLMGDVFIKMEKQDSAKYYYTESLMLAQSTNNKSDIVAPMRSLSQIYLSEGDQKKAYEFAKEAMNISIELDYPLVIANCAAVLSKVYAEQGKWEKAYEMHQIHSEKWEQVRNEEEKNATIRKMFQFEYDKKESLKEVEHQKEIALTEAEKEQQITINIAIAVGLLLTLIFAIVVVRRLRITRKQKEIIESQKTIVDAKNREILDSINYAQRIQEAFLKQEEYMNSKFPPHFIFFKPKDIVSGDFYWGIEKDGYLYMAVADCTGHGVPGAMMSMLGIAFLNEINAVNEILMPADILNKLRDKIIKELNKEGSTGETKDGLDISLIRMNAKRNEYVWAGANNPLYIVKDEGELIQVNGDKQPIGFYPDQKPFTDHKIELKMDDQIFLFSDGYPDQFGGENGKKFKYKNFKELLTNITSKNLQEQKDIVEQTLNKWIGYKNPETGQHYEQIDDITVVGLRINSNFNYE